MILLDEPWITLEGEPLRQGLCGVLSALSLGEEIGFERVPADAFHPWHAFLVQVGALASLAGARDGMPRMPTSHEEWRRALCWLSGRGERDAGAWNLLPAPGEVGFMQPAVTVKTGSARELKAHASVSPASAASSARGHDIKRTSIGRDWELWAYALVALQTSSGYGGRGLYGVERMNSGYGDRPFCGVRLESYTATWAHDVAVSILEMGRMRGSVDGVPLLWCETWDGPLAVADVHPLVVEVCRAIRLRPDGVLEARPTPSRRVDGPHDGLHGDIWTPVSVSGGERKAASAPTRRCADYREHSRWLFDECSPSLWHAWDNWLDGVAYFRFTPRQGNGKRRWDYREISMDAPVAVA